MGEERTARAFHEVTVPDKARELRANAWRFIFDCYAKKKAGALHTGDEAKGHDSDRPTPGILPH
jgi:hypothetical protein